MSGRRSEGGLGEQHFFAVAHQDEEEQEWKVIPPQSRESLRRQARLDSASLPRARQGLGSHVARSGGRAGGFGAVAHLRGRRPLRPPRAQAARHRPFPLGTATRCAPPSLRLALHAPGASLRRERCALAARRRTQALGPALPTPTAAPATCRSPAPHAATPAPCSHTRIARCPRARTFLSAVCERSSALCESVRHQRIVVRPWRRRRRSSEVRTRAIRRSSSWLLKEWCCKTSSS